MYLMYTAITNNLLLLTIVIEQLSLYVLYETNVIYVKCSAKF